MLLPMLLPIISRHASSERATVAAVCNNVCVLLWAVMPKPAPVWGWSLVIGGKLLIVVSSDLIFFCEMRQ